MRVRIILHIPKSYSLHEVSKANPWETPCFLYGQPVNTTGFLSAPEPTGSMIRSREESGNLSS